MKGKIIVIEGTDGSGKQTQAKLLKERLEQEGYSVYSTSFPNYPSDSSAPVRMYLNGQIKEKAEEVSAKAAAAFYAVDRYITYKKEIEPIYKQSESVIVFDRWVESNIIHQGAKFIADKICEPERSDRLEDFILWIQDLEYCDFGVPKPNTTIYLNVPVDYTMALRKNRANKITGGEKQDIHEASERHLIDASVTGMLAADILNWEVIECVKDGQMRTIEDIAEEVWQRVNK